MLSLSNAFDENGMKVFLSKITEFNTENKKMALHIDHIKSLFEGEKRGIPILTCLGLLNNDYLGGEFIMWGYNSRMDNLQAAILNYKLAYYGDEINRRREIASIYNENLSSISQIKLPKKPDEDDDYFDVYQNYEICAKHRDQFRNFLSDNGIGTLIQWGGMGIHHFKNLGFNQSLPNTDKFFGRF